MKRFNRFLATLCLALALCLAAQVALPAGVLTAALAEAGLSQTEATMYNDSTLQLKLNGVSGKVEWGSTKASVATVDASGLVYAKKVGTTKVFAVANGVKYTCAVKVISPLSVDVKKLTLDMGKSRDVMVTWEYTEQINVKWDNSAVVTASWGEWKGKTIPLKITAVSAGTTRITLSNVRTADTVTITVTVQKPGASKSQEISDLMGLKVSAANKKLKDKLKPGQLGYANKCFSVYCNSLKRINGIRLYTGKKRYTLMSVYPGMKSKAAVNALRAEGWKKAGRDKVGTLFVSSKDPDHVVRLQTSKGKVTCVAYFVPDTLPDSEI